jgi:uncharacterized iron-regulated membrane protein
MTPNRFVYKTHKWLAVGVGLFTAVWFASGIVMILPKDLLGKLRTAPVAAPAVPDFKAMTVSVSQAIAAAEAAAGANMVISQVELRPIEGRLYYQISTAKSGTHLIDAVSGARLDITEEYAKQMATRLVGEGAAIQESETVRKHDRGYAFGPLPVFRFVFADAASTIVYVSPKTGEMTASDRKGRLRGFIGGTHTFEFLRPEMTDRGRRIVLIVFSFVGLVMSLFGSWILWIQFQNWRARRAGRPEVV